MPKRSRKSYRTKRCNKRKNYRKKKNATKYVKTGQPYMPSVSKQMVPMFNKLKRTLKYVDFGLSLNPGVGGTLATYTFSANGLYDPNITGVGHQPMGFDQLIPFYNHYTVIGARIKATFINTSATSQCFVGIMATAASSISTTNFGTLIEQGNITYTNLALSGQDASQVDLIHKVSIGKFMGRRNILSEDDFRGSAAANPTEQVYFQLVAAPHSSVDLAALVVNVEVEYITIFTEPKELASS